MSEVMMKTGMVRNWVACGLLWGLTGCAALTIDVDVYKGPLSNDQDVQAEQTAVMAIGAKPMLIQLRNRLEESAMERFRESTRPKYYHHPDDRLPPLVERKGCGPFSPSSPISGFDQYWNDPLPSNYDFCDETAFRVNSILELYKDRGEENEFTPLLQTVMDELKKLEEAYQVLAAKGDQYRAQLQRDWDRLTADSLRKYGDKGKEFNDHLAALVKGFGTFLKGTGQMPYPREGSFLSFLNDEGGEVKDFLKNEMKFDLHEVMKKKWENKKLPGSNDLNWKRTDTEYSYTYWYLALANKEIVEAYADLIFDKNFSRNKEEFVQWVTQTAQSFIAAEKSLQKLLETNLKIIKKLGEPDNKEFKDRYLATAASLASNMISYRHLKLICKSHSEKMNIHGINICQSADSPYLLKTLIMHHPVETAHYFLFLDEWYTKSNDETVLNSLYGIAMGPTPTQENGVNSDIESVIGEIFAGNKMFAAGSLQGGRLNDGIETLLEEYLNLAHNQPQNSALQEDHGKKVEVKKDQLFKALARFAQKVLFISNYHRLFTVGTPDDTTLKYVDGLQAVGNSIISQVDEHNKRTRFEDRVKANVLDPESARKEAQALAFGMALSEDPERVRKRIIEALEAKKFPQNRFRQIAEEIQTLKNKIQAARDTNTEAEDAFNGAKARVSELESGIKTAKSNKDHWKTISDAFKPGTNEPWKTKIEEVNKASQTYKLEDYLTAIKKKLVSGNQDEIEVIDFLIGKKELVIDNPGKEKSGADFMKAIQEKAEEQQEIEAKNEQDKNKLLQDHEKNRDLAKKKMPQIREELQRIQVKLAEKEQELEGLKAKATDSAKLTAAINILKNVHTQLGKDVGRDPETDEQNQAQTLHEALTQLEHQGLLGQVEEALKAESGAGEMSNVNPNDYVVALEATRAIDSFKRLKERLNNGNDLSHNARNAKEVMETVVSALEYEYVAVVRDQGQNTPGARHLARAIKQAKEKVNRTKYIRPAADYLRSSFPSTALQVDPKIGWKNMLRNNGIRSILGDGLSDEQKERAKLKIDIDKQFWQNINRVHVSGAGDTNYVIIKDDVGNWVVKNYSASPEVIIQSAKGLALFGMGGGMGANLLGRSGIFESAETSPAEKLTTEQNKSLMERKLDSSTEDFQKASKADAEAAIKLAKSIVTDVQSKWNKTGFPGGTSGRQELEGVLTGTGTAQLADARKDLPENPDSAKEFRDRVAAIKKFYDAAKSKMKKLASDQKNSDQSGNETQKANQEEAIQTFTEVVQKKLLALINQREATMAKYDGTLTFLTDLLSE